MARALPGALLSTVNHCEAIAKLCDGGVPASEARTAIEATGVTLVDFDADQSSDAGALRVQTKRAGLSLGDRACLVLARSRGLPAMTADSAWANVEGFDVIFIRGQAS